MRDLRGDLRRRIEARAATIAVVGLGYVGLPLGCAFAASGFRVKGHDVNRERVESIASGLSPLDPDEPELADLVREVTLDGRLEASADASLLRGADVYLIAVETPVGADGAPRYEALLGACASIGRAIRHGALVVVESTVAPGTTGRTVREALERQSQLRSGVDFFLGHCPERVTSGHLLHDLRTLDRVCGGESPETATLIVALYRHVVSGDLEPTDLVTAELVKTGENAYRDVNIAFANEVALICEALGADAERVRQLINKCPGRHMLSAGAGVGGACIPKDPLLLASAAAPRVAARLITAARNVNDDMPRHVAALTRLGLARHGRSLADARVGVLGVSYREKTRDVRNSPTDRLAEALRGAGATVTLHDALVPAHRGPLGEVTAGADALILMVAHDEYRSLDLPALKNAMRTPLVVDGRRVVDAVAAEAAGLTYLAVGRGEVRWS